jgi:hypothetical protein
MGPIGTVLVVDPDPQVGEAMARFFRACEMDDVNCVWRAELDLSDGKIFREPYPIIFIFDEATVGGSDFIKELPPELIEIPIIFLSTEDLELEPGQVSQSDDVFKISKSSWRNTLAMAITKIMLFNGQH